MTFNEAFSNKLNELIKVFVTFTLVKLGFWLKSTDSNSLEFSKNELKPAPNVISSRNIFVETSIVSRLQNATCNSLKSGKGVTSREDKSSQWKQENFVSSWLFDKSTVVNILPGKVSKL